MPNPPRASQPKTLAERSAAYNRLRLIKDRIAKHLVGVGGISVIVFILLIFFYLAYVVAPLFEPATTEKQARYAAPGHCQRTVHLALEEQTQIGTRICDSGAVVFFRTGDGQVLASANPVPSGATLTSFAAGDPAHGFVAFGLSDGRALIAQLDFAVTYRGSERVIAPRLAFPLSDAPIQLGTQPLIKLALRNNEQEATLAAVQQDGTVLLSHVAKEVSFLDEEVTLQQNTYPVPPLPHAVDYLLVDKNQFHLFAISAEGEVSHFDITRKDEPRLIELQRLTTSATRISAASFLAGDISILVGDSGGTVSQWALVRQDDNVSRLMKLRDFSDNTGAVTALAPEIARKGFLAGDETGQLGIYHSTAHRTLLVEPLAETAVRMLAVAPRANALLAEDAGGQLQFWRIDNEHPEVSWSSLWGKVWYENYDEPAYIWQSSAANDDFEPKFSLMPITFGTLKAAFYAMLIAVPLSLMGALYTAQFMAPRMRTVVKPSIEVMEALPTVILGFLAGLWLAPYVEKHLPGVFACLLLLPVGLLLAAYAWSVLPATLRGRVREGWEAALLLPVVAGLIYVCLALSPAMEQVFFGGDMRLWLTNEMGVGFDQRNAIVVGLAMGFAIIPNIFSIAEDAVFGVPKHLVQGSLALGATPWQTMIRVVLLTASPGIFSAIMIGLGRAVGETMIVLMATGNTAVMDFSAFLGLRTLSANIAVELPESEVNSTHFRVLFLAGLVLFMFTFVVNTLAELVRQRLRRKYSSL